MATGYTAPVRDGVITFGQFVWLCVTNGRPPEFLPNRYAFLLDWAKNEDERADVLQAMSDAELEAHVGKMRRDYQQREKEYAAQKASERANYDAMIAKFEAWEPPPGNERIKTTLLRDLRESLEFDCPDRQASDEIDPYACPGDWRTEELAHLPSVGCTESS